MDRIFEIQLAKSLDDPSETLTFTGCGSDCHAAITRVVRSANFQFKADVFTVRHVVSVVYKGKK